MTWSAVQRVPVAPTTSSLEIFLAGIGVDHTTSGATAHLGVSFYFMPTVNCGTSTCKINAGFISSTNAGSTWSAAVKMFGAFRETGLANAGGYFLGDYMSSSFGSNGRSYPVLASAKGSACTLGQITSCHENMVAPTGGVLVTGGTNPATSGPVYAGGKAVTAHGRTAF